MQKNQVLQQPFMNQASKAKKSELFIIADLQVNNFFYIYTVKKVVDFPVHSRDVSNQTLPNREKFTYSRPERVSTVSDIPAGDGKLITFVYSVFSRWRLLSPQLETLLDLASYLNRQKSHFCILFSNSYGVLGIMFLFMYKLIEIIR